MKVEIIHNGYRKVVPAKHAEILVKLGKASYPAADIPVEPTAKNTESKSLEAEDTASDVKPKRQYKRRDMTAKNTESK